MFKSRKSLTIFFSVITILAVAGSIFYFSSSGKHDKYLSDKQKNTEQTEPSATTLESSIALQETQTSETNGQTTQAETTAVETNQEITSETTTEEKQLERFDAKALYITGGSAGSSSKMNEVIDLINKTELNAVVIDVKEYKVNYISQIPEVVRLGLHYKLYDPDAVIKKLHDNNIYVIARIVCYRDHLLATKRADLAVKKKDGSVWKEGGDTAWLNPYNEDAWAYNIEIAKEAALKGFDEIQFDYVRFPTGTKGQVDYGENPPTKSDAICGFLDAAARELYPLGVSISADIFGIVTESVTDGVNIGQELEKVGMNIDYISPMIYPSHYSNAAKSGWGANGYGQTINNVLFTSPDLEPYGVVYQSLIKSRERLSSVEGYKADIRPYIQAFTATYLPKGYYQTYGPEQIRQQIQAIYDAGYSSWILWNAGNKYPADAFLTE